MSFFSNFMNQIPTRLWRRHARQIRKYWSIKKITNAVPAMYYYLRGVSTIPTLPLFLKIEISAFCDVDCLYCTQAKDRVFFSFEKFKTIVDHLKNSVFMVQLYEIGEPLQHEQVLEFIEYAHTKRLATVISSNLSIEKTESFWRGLTVSGLDRLIVAIDGITEPVYRHYRRHGNLSLVMSNLKTILRHREQGASNLFVEWQMIDFPWNRSEQTAARQMAYDLGCDEFRIIPDAYQPRKKSAREGVIRQHHCLWPYVLLLVKANEDFIPCFKPDCTPGVLGNLGESDLDDLWNGPAIRQIRDKKMIQDRAGCRTCRE